MIETHETTVAITTQTMFLPDPQPDASEEDNGLHRPVLAGRWGHDPGALRSGTSYAQTL